MIRDGDERWAEEFRGFVAGDPMTPPEALRRPIAERIYRELHPALGRIFLKVGAIHILTGTLTLFFCPQFGLSITQHSDLTHFFMRYGHGVCMAACGVTFIGGTAVGASWLLRLEELRRLRAQPVWPWVALSALSLALMHLFGAEVLELYTLIWLAAAGMAGSGLFEAGFRLRRILCALWAH